MSLSTEGIFMLSEIPSLSTEGIDGVNMQFGFLLLIVPAGTLVKFFF